MSTASATVLERLQNWYAARCNGEWEHAWGVRIQTLDNPGWHVEINLEETPWQGVTFARVAREGEYDDEGRCGDWYACMSNGGKFIGFGDPSKLDLILSIFLQWIETGRVDIKP